MGMQRQQVAVLLQEPPQKQLGVVGAAVAALLPCSPCHAAALAPPALLGLAEAGVSRAGLTLHRLSVQPGPCLQVEQAVPFQVSAFLLCSGVSFAPANHTKRAPAPSFTSLHFKRFSCILEEILPLPEKHFFSLCHSTGCACMCSKGL